MDAEAAKLLGAGLAAIGAGIAALGVGNVFSAFLEGALAFCMLALLQWLVARLSIRSAWFSDLVRSRPRLLVEDGVLRHAALRDERVTRAEVEAAIRKSGIGRIEDVGAVVLESDGSLSVIARADGGYSVLDSVER